MSVKHIVAVTGGASGASGVGGKDSTTGAGGTAGGSGGVGGGAESDLLKVPLKLKNHKTDDGTPVLRRQTWQGDGQFTGWRKHEYKLITPEVYYVPSGAGELVEQVRYQLQDFPVLVHYFVMGNSRTSRSKRKNDNRSPDPKRSRQRLADDESADDTSSNGPPSGHGYGSSSSSSGGGGSFFGSSMRMATMPNGSMDPSAAHHPYSVGYYSGDTSLPPEMQPPMSLPACPPSPARISGDGRTLDLSEAARHESRPRQSPPSAVPETAAAQPQSLWSSLFGSDQTLSSTGATAVDTGPDLTDALAARAFSMDDPLNLNMFSSTDSLMLRSSLTTSGVYMSRTGQVSSASSSSSSSSSAASAAHDGGVGHAGVPTLTNASGSSLLGIDAVAPELTVVSYAPDSGPSDASTTVILVMQGVPADFTLTARFECSPAEPVTVTRLGEGVFQLMAPLPPAPGVSPFFVAAKPASPASQAQPVCTAQLPFFFTPSDERGRLSLAFASLREGVPALWVEKFRRTTRELDVSNNALSSLDWLGPLANHLTSLVADSNVLQDSTVWPSLPCLRTLSLNRNQFSSLNALLDSLEESCPQVQYLSLLGNECCPFFSGAESGAYRSYRIAVVRRLPQLRTLDSTRVTHDEREDAGVVN